MAPDAFAVDRSALRDRLFADAVSAPVRDADLFTRADPSISREDVERYVDTRAAAHQRDLGGTEADTEWARTAALALWRSALPHGRTSDRVVYALSVIAARLLCGSGSAVTLHVVHEEPGRELLRWRFISLALPPNLLISALAARNGAPNTRSVRLLDRSFAPDGRVAELHVHHAAMLTFEPLWAGTAYDSLINPGAFFAAIQDRRAICPRLHRGPCETNGLSEREHRSHMGVWADGLRQAFIARRLMQRHLWHSPSALEDCERCSAGVSAVENFTAGRLKRHPHGATPYPWPEELLEIQRDRRAFDPARRPATQRGSPVDWLEDGARRERAFLASAFKYLSPDEIASPDSAFERLFVQYLRVKAAVFRLLVHSPGEHGLRNFLDHFTQIKVYAPTADQLPPSRPPNDGVAVAAVEYRVAPDAWLGNRNRSKLPLARGEHSRSVPESAWLVHFKRKRFDSQTLPLYGSAFHELDQYGDRIARAFAFEPATLQALRGLDLCGVEGDQPLWVAAETLRRLTSASNRFVAQRPRSTIAPLRLTLHAGEDFVWLTSGVRAVAEPFVWKLMQRGDRIGHGIAITMTATDWWGRRAGRVFRIPRMDHLLNLAFLARYATDRSSEQESWLRTQIRRSAENIWPRGLVRQSQDVIGDAIDYWETLGTSLPRTFAKLRRKPAAARTAHRWLYSYLWDRSTQVAAAADIAIAVEPQDIASWVECELLEVARQKLIRELASWQICIESNPTSNLVVGSLDAITAQDFLHRRPTVAARQGDETLTWTISTDDPITFSTTLADEYAYAWAGMVLRAKNPYDPAYARALLDEAAATSMRMRFTIPNEDHDADRQQPGRSRDRRPR